MTSIAFLWYNRHSLERRDNMGAEIQTKALVLHEMQIGDYDKRLILLSKDLGKITAFAKGAKKTNSKLLAGSQIFCYGDYILFKGKNNYNVNQVSLIEPFHNLRQNMDTLTYGLYVLEFIEFITVENHLDHELMKLTLKSLKQLELGHLNPELIIKIFELKAMSFLGYSPWVTSCVLCNATDNINTFSSQDGGVICERCVGSKNVLTMNEGTRYTFEYILNQPMDVLFKFKLEDTVFNEFKYAVDQFVLQHLNKKFKALDFLSLEY